MISLDNEEVKIEYPCEWSYKVIVLSDANIECVTSDVLGERGCNTRASHHSKGGKYESYNISLLVHNDDDRHEVFQGFKKHEKVKMVL